jgi:hypothetical protein
MDVKHEVARFETAVRRHEAAGAGGQGMPRWASASTAQLAATVLHEHFQALGDHARTAEWQRRRSEWEQKADAAPPQTRPDAPYFTAADGEDD